MTFRHLLGTIVLVAATGVAVMAYAFNPQPDPPKSLLLCEADSEGTIKVVAVDGVPQGRIQIGDSCMGALSVVPPAGKRPMFNAEWFDVGGVAKLGIIIIGG